MQIPSTGLPDPSLVYLVAIGASAGGLEALSAFLRHLPDLDQTALIIAQHLSPHYPSQLAVLLGRETRWEVLEAADGLPLEPRKIFILPPQRELSLHENRLYLHAPSVTAGARPSVDLLFGTVAMQDYLHPIAIVLSGTGQDGALGIGAVKRAGGWTFAQAPETARHDGMPLAAMQTGLVDYVLAPAEIGPQLAALIGAFAWSGQTGSEGRAQPEPYSQLIELLTRRCGPDFSGYKPSTLRRRMQMRQLTLHLPDLAAYLAWVEQHPQELDALFHSILIGVTGFFRNPEVFAVLETCLRELIQRKSPGDLLRIWVPGCSTGEEAYSLAMLVERLMRTQNVELRVQIFATDIDERALVRARAGVYPEAALEQLPAELRASGFTARNGEYELNKSLRGMVLFSQHDLTLHPPLSKLDLISCRNLLIYFGAGLQKNILPSFHSALNPHGLLILGLSEDLGDSRRLFEPIHSALKIFRRLETSSGPFKALLPGLAPSGRASGPDPEARLRETVGELLIEASAHPFLLINDAFNVLQVYGDTSAYLSLPQGTLSPQLFSLCHKELQLELRSLILQAQREKSAALGLPRRWQGGRLRLRVQPELRHNSGLLLVVFEQQADRELSPADPGEAGTRRIAELEQELAARDAMMQALVEQLEYFNLQTQALNEELQSANEELQVSNEELATSNQELQATNEEMHVAYTELRSTHALLESKEAVLRASSANLQALLEHSRQAFVLVDTDYQIMTFNQQALRLHLQLYGQPISEGMLLLNAFSAPVRQTLMPLLGLARAGQPQQQDLALEHAGAPCWLRYDLIPVLGSDGSQVGIAVSALEVTEQEEIRVGLERSNELIDAIFNATDAGLCLIDEAGTFVKVNQTYREIYGYTSEELVGQPITMVVTPDEQEMLMRDHAECLRTGVQPPREWRIRRRDGRTIDVISTARVMTHPDGSRFKVATVRDITQDKKNHLLVLETQRLTGIGGWEYDIDTSERHWTPQIYAIYGFEPDAPLDDESVLAPYLPASRARMAEAFRRARENGEPYDLELELMRSNGEKIWVRTTCKVTRENGRLIRLNGIFQDITQRREASRELRRLSLVAQQIPTMVAIADADFRIVYANASYQTQTGYSLAELKGRSPLFLQGACTDPGALQKVLQAMLQQQPVQAELAFETRRGRVFWCEIQVTPVADAEGFSYIILQTDISERKQRAELLQFQSDILSHVQDSIVVSNLDGIITYWNKGAEEVFGYRAEERQGQSLEQHHPGFDCRAFLENYMHGKNPYAERSPLLRVSKAGQELWTEVRMDVIYNRQQQAIGVIEVANDITEKREVELALRSSEETFRVLLENSADGILVLDRQGHASYVSSSAERILGYAAQELQTMRVPELLYPPDRELLPSLAELTAYPGKSTTAEYRVRHRNGSWIWLECVHRNMLDDPHLQGIVCNFRNVTQRKETDARLHEHEQLYRSIAENFPHGMVMVLDAHLQGLFSEGQEKLPALWRPDGGFDPDCLPPTAAELVKERLVLALAGQQQSFELALDEDWYQFSIVPLRDSKDAVRRLLLVIQNITTIKRAEEDKVRLIRELTHQNEELNHFTYVISHNLRAPVANLLGLVNLLELEGQVLPEGAQTVRFLAQTTRKLDDIIRDLNHILDVRQRQDGICQRVDFAAELAWGLDNLASQYPEIRSWVTADWQVPECYSVRAYVQSILFNLLSNAVKYRHPERPLRILVSSSLSGNHICIRVCDNGLGLDLPAVQGQIFRLYKRFHQHIEGKGMGLYLIKAHAEALGGWVELSSQPDEGCTFSIYIQVTQPAAVAQAPD